LRVGYKIWPEFLEFHKILICAMAIEIIVYLNFRSLHRKIHFFSSNFDWNFTKFGGFHWGPKKFKNEIIIIPNPDSRDKLEIGGGVSTCLLQCEAIWLLTRTVMLVATNTVSSLLLGVLLINIWTCMVL
jgi:hypothetical protein